MENLNGFVARLRREIDDFVTWFHAPRHEPHYVEHGCMAREMDRL